MHCSTGQGRMHPSLLSAALQNRLTAGTVSLQLHLWRKALHTSVQGCNTSTLQHWSGQNSSQTVESCSAKQAHSRHCVSAITPMKKQADRQHHPRRAQHVCQQDAQPGDPILSRDSRGADHHPTLARSHQGLLVRRCRRGLCPLHAMAWAPRPKARPHCTFCGC